MSMRAEFINPFLDATMSVLKTMASAEVVPGKPYIKTGSAARGDISGVVGITGQAEGSLCLTFPREVILQVMTNMLGEEQKEITEEVKDAVGELTNMISGDSRRRLQEKGYTFQGSIPSVISGPGHEVKHITKGPVLSIPFSLNGGNFVVEVCFK
jgi:chemotaxis protein CheX